MTAETPRSDDQMLDEALEESFPASDPPARTVDTGARIALPPVPVTDNQTAHRLEIAADGSAAFLVYERTAGTFVVIHTEVPPSLRGRDFGETLVDAAVRIAHDERRRLVPVCPFAKAYLRRRQERTT